MIPCTLVVAMDALDLARDIRAAVRLASLVSVVPVAAVGVLTLSFPVRRQRCAVIRHVLTRAGVDTRVRVHIAVRIVSKTRVDLEHQLGDRELAHVGNLWVGAVEPAPERLVDPWATLEWEAPGSQIEIHVAIDVGSVHVDRLCAVVALVHMIQRDILGISWIDVRRQRGTSEDEQER